jgi:xanthine/CO dehydrogenase XdhC/CoxF family maturation factor
MQDVIVAWPDAALEQLGGLDLGAVGPEEMAISIIGELLAVCHRRDGGRLSRRGPGAERIH